MISSRGGRLGLRLASAATALLILTGCATTGQPPAQTAPAAAALAQLTASPEQPKPSPSSEIGTKFAAASTPLSFRIPSIGAQSRLLSLGLRGDGSLEVPPEGPGSPAGWYNGSPTPGELGPAVILGHVNATGGGPGVFANLRKLKPGDIIQIAREDGKTVSFVFDHSEQYPKNAFPTQRVYGNTEGPELRLITCDGYDPATGEFDNNYVGYAKVKT